MRDESVSMHKLVEKTRRRHEDIAEDRRLGAGRLGDDELLGLLLVPYPTALGQRDWSFSLPRDHQAAARWKAPALGRGRAERAPLGHHPRPVALVSLRLEYGLRAQLHRHRPFLDDGLAR